MIKQYGKQMNTIRHFFITTLFLFFGLSLVQAQKPDAPRFRQPKLTNWTWTTEKWIGDDKPYVSLRSAIDQSTASNNGLTKTMKQRKEIALTNPKDPKAQFAYAYTVVIAGRQHNYPVSRAEAREIALALAYASSPKTYEYARLRFITTMRWATHLQLKNLGLRLLRHSPEDYYVKYYVVKALSYGSAAERRQALSYANELVRSQPKRATAYAALGKVHEEMFWSKEDETAGQQAVKSYQMALKYMPPNDYSRRSVQRLIALIQNQQRKR